MGDFEKQAMIDQRMLQGESKAFDMLFDAMSPISKSIINIGEIK